MGHLENLPPSSFYIGNSSDHQTVSTPFSQKMSETIKKVAATTEENFDVELPNVRNRSLLRVHIAKECPSITSRPAVEQVAKRMGLYAERAPTILEFEQYVDAKSKEILSSLYGTEGGCSAPSDRELMHKIIATALRHHLLAIDDSDNRTIEIEGEEYLLVEKMHEKSFTLIQLTGELLGKGSFATVEKVTDISSGQAHAFKHARSFSNDDLAKLSLEAVALRKKRAQDNIVKSAEMTQAIHKAGREKGIDSKEMRFIEHPPLAWVKTKEGKEGFIAAELFKKGSLSTKKYSMSQNELLHSLEQVITGLKILEALAIRWGDGKTENIFIESKSGEVRLGDFDGAKPYDELHMPTAEELAREADECGGKLNPETLMGVTYTEEYVPKELIERLIEAVEKQDNKLYIEVHREMELFSHAALLFELLTGNNISDLAEPPLRDVAIANKERVKHIEQAIRGKDIDEIFRSMNADNDTYILDAIEIDGEEYDIYAHFDSDSGDLSIWAPDDDGKYGYCGYERGTNGQWTTPATLFNSRARRMVLYPDGAAGKIIRSEYLDYLFDPTGPESEEEKELVAEFEKLFIRAVEPYPTKESSIETTEFLEQLNGLVLRLKKLRRGSP